MLDQSMLDAALQRDPEHRGLQVAQLERFRYQNGFRARDLRAELDCDTPTWVPFTPGFGDINVAMFPNGATWYDISDDGKRASIDITKPAIENAKLARCCAGD